MGKISPILIGAGGFVIVIVVGIIWMQAIYNVNPNSITPSELSNFSNTFDKYADLQSSGNDIRSSIENNSSDQNFFQQAYGVFDAILGSGWNFLKSIFGTTNFIGAIISDIGRTLGIPSYLVGIILTMLTLYIGFIIYSIIFQSDA